MTLEGRIERHRLPDAGDDGRARPARRHGAAAVFAELRCPKTLLRFTAAEGAGDHCEMRNRALLNRRVLDWLDETLRP